MAGTRRAAVVIVSWNSREHLPRVLRDLAAQTTPPARTIVVDNASGDGTPDLVRREFPSVELIETGSNRGFAEANNIGVAAAGDCEIVALLNPDAFPDPGWLEALLRAADEYPGHSFFGSRMMRVHRPDELDGSGDLYHVSGLALRRDHGRRLADAPEALVPGETFSVCAGAAAYRRATFLAAGGFDSGYGSYFEDTDLAFRLRLAGERGRYVPDSVVHHVGSASAGEEGEYTVYHSSRNLVWTWAKNMPGPLMALYLPFHVAANLFMLAWYVVRGRGRAAARGQLDALRDLPRIAAQRRAIQERRRVGVRELRASMTTGAGDVAGIWRRTRRPRGPR